MRILSGRVPSLILESSFGRAFPRFYIRGLGNSDFDLNASQPVSMVVDEIVLENPMVKAMPLFDLDRVEVLRGPQGTLFGRNTTAGVVKFETRKPTAGLRRLRAAVLRHLRHRGLHRRGGRPAARRRFSARVSGLYQSRSDWVDNLYDRPRTSPRRLRQHRLAAAAPVGADGALRRPAQRPRLGGRRHRPIFRANIIEQGTNRSADDFERDEVYHDGLNKQEICVARRRAAAGVRLGGAT